MSITAGRCCGVAFVTMTKWEKNVSAELLSGPV